jgi:hypothetical protein
VNFIAQEPAMTHDFYDLSAGRVSRRNLLRGAVAGAAVAALPVAAPAAAAVADAGRFEVELGYWQGGQRLPTTTGVRAGWLPPCASSAGACAVKVDDELVSTDHLVGSAGPYRIRVLGMGASAALVPVRVEALYSDVPHRLWQTWREGSTLQASAPVSSRWSSASGEGLRLRLTPASADARELTVPAHPGIYVATLALDERVPRWRRIALRGLDGDRPLTLSLVERRSGAASPVPHLLLAVERVTA